MSLRLLTCSLLLIALALFTRPLASQNGQGAQNPTAEPKWEYKVLRIDANQCSSENDLATSLNFIGQQGWELLSYERFPLPFPKDAEGTLLLKPAATGHGAQTTPHTADSFQGTITMKMVQAQSGGCRLMFKRPWHPTAR
jgi:hypothetical protein